MKKLAAILLAALLFFNWYGYRLLADYLQFRSDERLELKLDNNDYDESQLMEVRIPLNLPYHNDWQGYERYNGDIDFNGVHYKYVKRKVENGELVLLCIPNAPKQQIQSARDEFFKLVNDLQQSPTGKKSDNNNNLALKNFLGDYRQEKNNWAIAEPGILHPDYSSNELYFPSSGYQITPEQPPEC